VCEPVSGEFLNATDCGWQTCLRYIYADQTRGLSCRHLKSKVRCGEVRANSRVCRNLGAHSKLPPWPRGFWRSEFLALFLRYLLAFIRSCSRLLSFLGTGETRGSGTGKAKLMRRNRWIVVYRKGGGLEGGQSKMPAGRSEEPQNARAPEIILQIPCDGPTSAARCYIPLRTCSRARTRVLRSCVSMS
jgi:hypothetical protein